MAVNKYIGMRYVPIIKGAWDSLQEYEPLSIVIHEGNSYTSKTHVPSGIEITNEQYWVKTGDYNAQIVQYQQDVKNLERRVDEFSEDINKANEGVEAVKQDVETLGQEDKALGLRIDDTESDLTSLTKRVQKLEDEKNGLLIISDSYGDFEGNTFIEQIQGTGFYNPFYEKHIGGAGFVNGSTTFIDLLTQAGSSISDKESVTTILVAGGYNDYASDETVILSAIDNFMVQAKSLFPKATVKIAFIGWGKNTAHWVGLMRTCGVYSRCGIHGAEFIDGAEYILHDYSFFDSDGAFHPNQKGHDALTKYLLNGLKTGNCDVVYGYKTLSFTPKEGVTLENVNGMSTVLNKGVVSLRTVKLNFGFTQPVNINMNGRNALSLGNFKDGYLYGDADSLCSCICSAFYLDKNASKYRMTTGTLVFTAGKLSFIPADVEDDGQTYRTVNVGQLQILAINHTFDAMVS